MTNIFDLQAENNLLKLNIPNPFSYDLGLTMVSCKKQSSEITICCHGYGGSSDFVNIINSYNIFSGHLIGFNFPDYKISNSTNHSESSFGTPMEIMPLVYVLKKVVVDLKIPKINLYGLSAGGGAIINLLHCLLSSIFDEYLNKYGIDAEDKRAILKALANGYIILDCPLKSIEEILAFRSSTPELEIMAKHYSQNNMIPIEVLNLLHGLHANILLNFQKVDEVLGNRDDELFIARLSKINQGTTTVSIGLTGGHSSYHAELASNFKKKPH